jgi:hypothetical protein
MRGTNNKANADKSAVENDQALRLRCVSPLHAIPGFDRLSHRLTDHTILVRNRKGLESVA